MALVLSLAPEDVADLVVHSALGVDGKAKRLFDIAFAGAFLAAGWPAIAAIAAGVKLSSPGAALFKQRSYGRDAQEIHVLKSRTTRVTENGAVVRQAKRGHARITRFGAFLRTFGASARGSTRRSSFAPCSAAKHGKTRIDDRQRRSTLSCDKPKRIWRVRARRSMMVTASANPWLAKCFRMRKISPSMS